jgi:hypothetical protein
MSSTVIDSLVLKIGLDGKDFDRGKGNITGGLKDITKLLAIIGGTAALKVFARDMIESNAALERFSRNVGLSVQSVSAWGQATEQAGGSAAGLQGSIEMLSKAQTDMMLTGQSSLLPYLSALGVAIADASGKARPATDIMVDLAGKFEKMDRVTAHNMARSMGFDEGTVNLMLRGRAEVERMVTRQKESSAVTKAQAEQSEKMREKIVQVKQEFAAFGRELLADAMPVLENLIDIFRSIAKWAQDNKEFVGAFLTIIATGIAAISIAALPLTGTTALILGLSAAIAALWQDYKVWKRGGQSLINWEYWDYGIHQATRGILYLKNVIMDLWFSIKALGRAFYAIWNHDWDAFKGAVKDVWTGNGKAYSQPDEAPMESPSGPLFNRGGGGNASQREAQALRYFQAQGWTAAQAAGIVANLKRESAFNSQAVGDSGKAFGIAQWHPDRQEDFKRTFGKDIRNASFEEQLAFVQYELTRGREKAAGDRLRRSSSAGESGAIVSRYYERPAAQGSEAALRGNIAANAGAGVAVTGRGGMFASPGSVSNVENNIGAVNVYTQATDAEGIAKGLGRAMDYQLTAQADTGAF